MESDVWSSTGISCPRCLSQTLWATSLARMRRERAATLLYLCQVRAFSPFKKRLKNSPINSYKGAEGTESTGRQWGNGIIYGIIKCGVSISEETGNSRDH